MEQVFNSLDEMILIVDSKEKILFANSKLLKRFRISKEEVNGACINTTLRQDTNILSELISNFDNNRRVSECIFSLGEHEKIYCNAIINREIWYGEEAFFITIKEKEKYSRRDLETILDSLPYGVWMKDVCGKYIYANTTHAETFGIKNESIIGYHNLDFVDESLCDYYNKTDREVIISKRPILDEKLINKPDGDKWFETYKGPILDECGEVKYIVGISRDITFNKKVELELVNSHNQLGTLNHLVVNSHEGDNGLFDNLKEEIIDKLGADNMSIWTYDDKESKLCCECYLGKNSKVVDENTEISLEYKDLDYFFENPNNEGLKTIEERRDLINNGLFQTDGIRFIGVYKIELNNKIIGVMNILYSEIDVEKLNNDDFIKTLCNQIAVLIRNDKLSKEIKLELKKRRETENELQLFLDTAVDLMVIIGDDYKYRKVNHGWKKTLGWSAEELSDMDWTDILHPDDIKPTEDFVEILKNEDKIMTFKNRYICKNGDIKWIQWQSRYLKSRKVSICTGKDITKQRQLEEQRKNYEEAIQLEQIKSEFFSNISHEFKTPLNIILATMQLINHNIENKLIYAEKGVDLKRYMNSIKQNSYRLLRLVNNLIDITKIDAGYYELQLANHNIVSIVEDITISVAQYIENKGVELIFDTEIEEEIIACDPDKIERIMLNLLSNAIKYTKADGKIEVYLGIKDKKVFVSVQDNGEGINEEKVKVIFDRFTQVDDTLARRYEGSGIGLSLVKSLIEMHGGSIDVISQVGEGTKFTFSLPIMVLEDENQYKKSLPHKSNTISSKVEKCNIEFSDIYN